MPIIFSSFSTHWYIFHAPDTATMWAAVFYTLTAMYFRGAEQRRSTWMVCQDSQIVDSSLNGGGKDEEKLSKDNVLYVMMSLRL